MKKFLLTSFLFLFLLSCSVYAQSYLPSIDIILTQQMPNPTEPGQTVNLELTIENDGYSEAENMVVEFITKSPFSLIQGETAKKTFNRIPAAGSLKTTYRLYVDSSAMSNDYELEFRIYGDLTPANYIKKTITVSVHGRSELIIDSIKTIPENLEPGGLATILFKIRNVGTGTVRAAKATLSSDSEEIIPVYSAGLVYIGDITPNETAQVSMQISIDSSAEYKTYVTTLTMNYKDENNADQSTVFSVGIPVMGSINLDIIKIEPNFNRNKIEIEVANKGTTDAKSVEAKLFVDGEMIDVDYLSTLKATKKTTLDFPLIFKGQGQLVIDYVGPGLEQNQVTMDIVFDFVPQGSSSSSSFFLLIVIVVIGFFAWRKKWHHKLPFFKKKH